MDVRRWKPWLWGLLLVAGVLFLGSLPLIRATVYASRPTALRPTHEGIGELVGSSRVCQSFLSEYDGLARIEVLLDDLGRENSGPFQFSLRASPDGQDLVSLTHDAAEVRHDAYHAFTFPPIPDSAGRGYAFCLEAPEAPLDQAITAVGTLEDTYPDGHAVFRDMWGGRAGVQDLDFRTAYRLSLPETLLVLLDRLVAYKPFPFGSRWFCVALGLSYVVLLYLLFLRLYPRARRDDAE